MLKTEKLKEQEEHKSEIKEEQFRLFLFFYGTLVASLIKISLISSITISIFKVNTSYFDKMINSDYKQQQG